SAGAATRSADTAAHISMLRRLNIVVSIRPPSVLHGDARARRSVLLCDGTNSKAISDSRRSKPCRSYKSRLIVPLTEISCLGNGEPMLDVRIEQAYRRT